MQLKLKDNIFFSLLGLYQWRFLCEWKELSAFYLLWTECIFCSRSGWPKCKLGMPSKFYSSKHINIQSIEDTPLYALFKWTTLSSLGHWRAVNILTYSLYPCSQWWFSSSSKLFFKAFWGPVLWAALQNHLLETGWCHGMSQQSICPYLQPSRSFSTLVI